MSRISDIQFSDITSCSARGCLVDVVSQSLFPTLLCVFFFGEGNNIVTFGCHVPGAGAKALAGLFRNCSVQSREIKDFSLVHMGKLQASSVNCLPASYEISQSVAGNREERRFGFCFHAVAFWNCTKQLLQQECI